MTGGRARLVTPSQMSQTSGADHPSGAGSQVLQGVAGVGLGTSMCRRPAPTCLPPDRTSAPRLLTSGAQQGAGCATEKFLVRMKAVPSEGLLGRCACISAPR